MGRLPEVSDLLSREVGLPKPGPAEGAQAGALQVGRHD